MHESYQNAITARPASSPRRMDSRSDGRFVESVGVHVGLQDVLIGEGEDGGEIVARAKIAAADGDAFEDGID